MTLWNPDLFHEACEFAAAAHDGQKIPGQSYPYVLHPCGVALEVATAIAQRGDVERPDLAVVCALLHDVVEDTTIGLDTIASRFGRQVADGVWALTKNPDVGDKRAQMKDSLARIREQPPEVWMVKLADRIYNLREPPHYWKRAKVLAYREEAILIHTHLAEACRVLAARLSDRIVSYAVFAEGRA